MISWLHRDIADEGASEDSHLIRHSGGRGLASDYRFLIDEATGTEGGSG